MVKKRKFGKDTSDDQQPPEKEQLQPRIEIQNLISALEAKETIPMLKSSIHPFLEEEHLVESPSFLSTDSSPSLETKLILESKKSTPHEVNKKYLSTGNLYGDIGVFLTELTDSYAKRYNKWEESTNLVLAVLRNLQITTLDNSQDLITTIGSLQEQINNGLERFRVKRNYVEQYSESNHTEVAQMLKKTLDLLALQIKEFKLKNLLNQLISIYGN